MAPLEEILADRIGQWEASDRKDAELREQIALLLALAERLDEPYVCSRVAEDTGEAPDLSLLKARGP